MQIFVKGYTHRLLEYAPLYFDPKTFPDGEMKRVLQRVYNKKMGLPESRTESRKGTPSVDVRDTKRRRKV